MRVLGIDTSSKVGSAAVLLWDGEGRAQTLSEQTGGVDARHGETLLPLVRAALVEARVELGAVDLLAIGCGPGSFTGTRIGLAAAKGFVIGARLPLVGVSSFAVIARKAARELNAQRVAVVGDAGRGGVFAALYEWSEGQPVRCVIEPLEYDPQKVSAALGLEADTLLVGTGLRTYPFLCEGLRAADESYDTPLACEVADEGRLRWQTTGPDDAAALEPNYVRSADAKLPTKKLELTPVTAD